MLLSKCVNVLLRALSWGEERTAIGNDIPRYHLKDEVRRFFLAIISLRDRVLFDLMYRHGLRRREAAQMRVDNINLVAGTIEVRRLKGSRDGVYRLHKTSIRLLRRYLSEIPKDAVWLFPGRSQGTHLSPSTIYYLCRKYARAAGLRRENPHAFRHSCGVHAANARLDLIDIADHLGHRSLTTAMRYAAVSSKRRAENFERMVQSGEFASTV